MEWLFIIGTFMSLMAVLDPLAAVPTFIAVCPHERKASLRLALISAVTVFVTMVLFAMLGKTLLAAFAITLPAFRAAGGVLILLMGVEMLHGSVSRVKQTPREAEELDSFQAVGIVPLAIPLMAGPGAMTTIMLLSQNATDWSHRVALYLIIAVCSCIVFAVLCFAAQLQARLGFTGINILNRIMGLVLAAVGMQFIGDGLRELLPGLAGPLMSQP